MTGDLRALSVDRLRRLIAAGLTAGLLGCPAVRQETGGSPGHEGATETKGAVVEALGEASVFLQAGLRPGDVILAWERPPAPPANSESARGEVETVFDWMWLEVEQAPRGPLKLFGERDGQPRRFEIAAGSWDARLRPRLAPRLLEVYARGRDHVDAGEVEQGAGIWRGILRLEEVRGNGPLRSWILLCIAEVLAEAGAWQQAQDAYAEVSEPPLAPRVEMAIRDRAGKAYAIRRGLIQAEAHYRSALETAKATWPRSLHTAKMQNSLGAVALYQRRHEVASSYFEEALEIREELAPGSIGVADCLNNLGIVAERRGELRLASSYFERDVKITQELAPDSLGLAATLTNLGILAEYRGELERADEYYRHTLDIRQRLAPDSLELAKSLRSLGNVAADRGEPDLAEEYLRRDLEITRRIAPGSLDLAESLYHSGSLAYDRGELETAEEFFQRDLEITRKLAPESLDLAASLGSLGAVVMDQGELDRAESYFRRALAIEETVAPDSLNLAASLSSLGDVARARGELDAAGTLYRRAVEITGNLAPESLELASNLSSLGEVMRARGELARAAELFERAVDTLEVQISNLGASYDVQARYRAEHGELYRRTIETLLRLERPAAAFAMLESSRARAFLALLSERDLIFSDLSEDLDRERRRLGVIYERTQQEIADLDPADEDLDPLRGRLRELRRQLDDNTDKIRRASPKYAALRYPEPLGHEGVRQALDEGTVMLCYSVGADESFLFVVDRKSPLRTHRLDVGEKDLEQRLRRFADRLYGRSWPRVARGRLEMAQWLYRMLVEPAAGAIEHSERLLVVPDGPLHRLAFAALVRTGALSEPSIEDDRGWHYLVEWKPIHTVLSGTVYAELLQLRRPPGRATISLAAFGDPRFPEDTRSKTLHPLPYTRTEVQAVAAHFGSEPVRTYLGEEATEERVKALGRDVRVVHFATHGLVDDAMPLSSSLALTIPAEPSEDRENGFLQVWEIFERVRLDADLVVLSACRTAAGREQFGEGLIGLSRGFQYAGARTVLATLWSVADHTTAELMSRFYGHLRAGMTKDTALRVAQLELIRGEVKTPSGEPAVAPYYWAAFRIIGDWQ